MKYCSRDMPSARHIVLARDQAFAHILSRNIQANTSFVLAFSAAVDAASRALSALGAASAQAVGNVWLIYAPGVPREH
jgi:hypothetical protein